MTRDSTSRCWKTINSVDILSDGGIIFCEARRETGIAGDAAPYARKRKEYRYGKVKVCITRRRT